MIPRTFYPAFSEFLKNIDGQFAQIPEQRKQLLEQLGAYIREKREGGKTCNLVFICTHNSRRSHISEIFAHAASRIYGAEHVQVFSGGTEATALNPNAIAALKQTGLQIEAETTGNNPRYRVRTGESDPGIVCFSKTYDQVSDSLGEFAAIMTCSDADEACPIIPGAEVRLPIRYEDPKQFDGTPEQDQAYADTCRIIARQMFYAFSRSV
ncbi:MAG: protein-tyrosine-phosphatase [Cyclonatronaceae bacterium]